MALRDELASQLPRIEDCLNKRQGWREIVKYMLGLLTEFHRWLGRLTRGGVSLEVELSGAKAQA